MRVLSLDISLTATGIATAADGRVCDSGVICGKGDGVARLIDIRNRVMDRVDAFKPDLVVMEDFSYGSSDGKAFERAGCAYMIRAELFSDKVPYCAVSPMALKKFACGSAGSAKAPVKKELVLLNVFKRWGHDVKDNNEADALVLAHIGMCLLGDEEPSMEPQRQVLQKVRENFPFLNQFVQTGQKAEPVEVDW